MAVGGYNSFDLKRLGTNPYFSIDLYTKTPILIIICFVKAIILIL
jgi:hypothetical protein